MNSFVCGLLRFGGLACALLVLTLKAAPEAAVSDPPAQMPAASAPDPISDGAVPVSYSAGQLSINVLNTSLADILMKVAALTKAKIDIPADANTEQLAIVRLGPGSPREVLASLLRDTHFSYLIQASDTDPDQIQGVVLMRADTKVTASNDAEAPTTLRRGIYARTVEPVAKPQEPEAPITPVALQPDSPPAVNTPAAPIMADQPGGGLSPQPNESNLPRPGALNPPQNLSPQSMNQQLQQMYQQRMQMVQQDRQAVPQAGVANH